MCKDANFPIISTSWRCNEYKEICQDDVTSMKRETNMDESYVEIIRRVGNREVKAYIEDDG